LFSLEVQHKRLELAAECELILTHTQNRETAELLETMGQTSRERCWGKKKKAEISLENRFSAFCRVLCF